MKHFVIEIIYIASLDEINKVVDEHRKYLKQGYENGMILMSGPQVPRIGGLIIARADNMEIIADFFSKDPYKANGLANYNFIEFNPVNYQDFLNNWIENIK